MNKGKIEQAGSPLEVFETPATEFVARFLGGHNVIRTPAGLIAVRADRTRLTRNGATNALPATVTGVEYQGASYAVALEGAGEADLSAIVGDAEFQNSPVAVGDQVGLVWSEADIQPVSPAA
jgi:putative spermidine/putrescine transport system ATP-binding protein